MSQCGPDCDCPESKARKLMALHHVADSPANEAILLEIASLVSGDSACPQSCGRPWPDCGCATAEIKLYVLKNSTEAAATEPYQGRRRRLPGRYHGRSALDMMRGLQGQG